MFVPPPAAMYVVSKRLIHSGSSAIVLPFNEILLETAKTLVPISAERLPRTERFDTETVPTLVNELPRPSKWTLDARETVLAQ